MVTAAIDARPNRSTAVSLSLLDGFALSHEDRRLELPLSAQRVVAFLALRTRPVQRVYVSGQLWPDMSEVRAGAALRTALWRAGSIGCPLITAHGQALAIDAGVRVDVREAERAARTALHGGTDMALHAGTDTPDMQLLCDGGDLLPDWYEDWVLLERERLRQLTLQALEARALSALEGARHGAALEAALTAVRAEPLRESAHRIVVMIHIAQGNVVEAQRHVEWYRVMLHDQLGLEPSPAMIGLLRTHPVNR